MQFRYFSAIGYRFPQLLLQQSEMVSIHQEVVTQTIERLFRGFCPSPHKSKSLIGKTFLLFLLLRDVRFH